MKDCSRKLVVLAKNNAKQRMYFSLKKVEIKLYFKNVLSEEHYILIQNVLDDSREKWFLKKKKQLIDKCNSLLGNYSQHSNYKTGLIKPAILNLTKEEIPKHYESLLNLKLFIIMLKILLRQQGETSKTDEVVGKPGSLFLWHYYKSTKEKMSLRQKRKLVWVLVRQPGQPWLHESSESFFISGKTFQKPVNLLCIF